jgi:trk system potassium uptake protein TrkA
MKKQFAVIGMGRFGSEVARTLFENRHDVIAIDRNESRVKEVSDHVTMAVQLDAVDEKAMREAGVQNVDVAIVSIGENIESSILVVMTLKDLGIKNIVAKAVSETHGRILAQLGVRRVVHPERDMAQKVAYSLIRADVLEMIELSPDYSIVEYEAPDIFQDQSISDVNLRAKHGITIIAIKRQNGDDLRKETWNINPHPSEVIKKGDTIVILGSNKDIEKFNALK